MYTGTTLFFHTLGLKQSSQNPCETKLCAITITEIPSKFEAYRVNPILMWILVIQVKIIANNYFLHTHTHTHRKFNYMWSEKHTVVAYNKTIKQL
jgi:hypothetical protein